MAASRADLVNTGAPAPMTQGPHKLDQLTSLRFVAAFMIVLHHADGLFGISPSGVNLGQGVSFFFVLSGFILAYVYPRLATWGAVRHFWRARLARVWPGFLLSAALAFVLLDQPWRTLTAVPYLLLVQAWIPMSSFYFAYNAVAWSISTEVFFYLLFPALIWRWRATWHWKAAAALALLLALMLAARHWSLPSYGAPYTGGDGMLVTQHGLLYISPLARLVEFVFGMCVMLLWRHSSVGWRRATATVCEASAVLLCVASLSVMSAVSAWIGTTWLGAPAALWSMHAGSLAAFGVLIYVMAHGRGALSAALRWRGAVLLGEISFALYLLHQTLLSYYRLHPERFRALPDGLAFGLYLLILLLCSYLMWILVEMPARKALLGHYGRPDLSFGRLWRSGGLRRAVRPLAAALVLGLVLVALRVPAPPVPAAAPVVTPAALSGFAGAGFGQLFVLRALELRCAPTAVTLRLQWQSLTAQPLQRTVAVHLVDAAGAIRAQADYPQSAAAGARVEAGQVWTDQLVLGKDQLPAGVSQVAIGLFEPTSQQLLTIAHGGTDWGGHRLLVPLPCRVPL